MMTAAEWQRAYPEKARAACRRWRAKHPEKARDSAKEYRKKNRAKLREAHRVWCANNPEKVKEYETRNRANHPETQKNWRTNNREKTRKHAKRWRNNHPEKVKDMMHSWVSRNPVKIRAYKKRSRAKYRNDETHRVREREVRISYRRNHGVLEREEYNRRIAAGEIPCAAAVLDVSVVKVIKGLRLLGCSGSRISSLFDIRPQTVYSILSEVSWRGVVAYSEADVFESLLTLIRGNPTVLIHWMTLTLSLEIQTLQITYEKRSPFLEFCHSVLASV